jgi:hypothetical protein
VRNSCMHSNVVGFGITSRASAAFATTREMKFVVRIVLWLGAIAVTIFGLLLMAGALDSSGSDAAGRGLSQAYGMFIALLGGAAVLSLLLTRFWRGFLVIGGLFLVLPFVLILLLSIGRSVGERHNDQFTADVHSGRYNFGEHPELVAVAEAIAKNDSNAIRASAKNVRDLNAAGRDGMTLLFFAVNESLERPELASAVETLLALGVNPNYHNDSANSYALAQSVSADIGVLRAMLDAGGDPNGRDVKGQPIVFDNWFMEPFKGQRPQRLRLLLDRGTDVNSINPLLDRFSLLLYSAHMGAFEPQGYVDAQLLNRAADFKYVADDRTTLMKLLSKQRQEFTERGATPPPEYTAVCDWLARHGVASER